MSERFHRVYMDETLPPIRRVMRLICLDCRMECERLPGSADADWYERVGEWNRQHPTPDPFDNEDYRD